MQSYDAPLEDIRFNLFNVFKAQQSWPELPLFAEVIEEDTAAAMLEEAAKIAKERVAPYNQSGDQVGVKWHEGQVTTPEGFKEAYKEFAEGGWTALCGNPEYGGLGMPKVLSVLVDEMMYAANTSFALYPALSAGATVAIDAHATEELKQTYLPNIYSGTWAATMCLTEPHCGSDLGIMRTKAEPSADGTYKISGTKIFITGGEHDLAENIIHLVLAKLPDAPEGSKGISLFLVPKFKLNDNNEPGEANGVSCGSIEHKMGIKASATCVMNFDEAEGYLVGELNRGLNCMFTMMNYERLSIGIQGIGAGQMSYQNAVAYAKDRKQGRAIGDSEKTSSIIKHPDVRRMLLTMKSTTEAGRAMAIYTAMYLDIAKAHSDADVVKAASKRVALLTPVAKSFFTDLGLENTITGQQVFGGHGFISEWGQEQLVRDVRIAPIYEGTNGIQALDFMFRKVAADGGEALFDFFAEIKAYIDTLDSEYTKYGSNLVALLDQVTDLTNALIQRGKENPDELGGVACEFLDLVGYITYAYMWLKNLSSLDEAPSEQFKTSKITTAAFYFDKVLPRADALISIISNGAQSTMAVAEDDF